jgi:CDP-diacylglycerol--serine O-phosphatidyltransferase
MNVIKWIPNFFTCLNLAIGMAGIINLFKGDYTNTILFILLAALFDFMDGFLARLLKATGELGKQLDSLADLVTFGVLPSLYVFKWANLTGQPDWISYGTLLIGIFSALRLAKFNLDETQSEVFKGLPTPANAIMLTTLSQLSLPAFNSPYFYIGLTLISSFLLVSPIRMIALKFKSFRFRTNASRFVLIFIYICLIGWVGVGALPYLIPLYVLVSIITSFGQTDQKTKMV